MFALGPMAKAAKLKHSTGTQNFEAPLERLRSRLNWVVAYIRFDAARVWGLRGQIKVKGQINGFAFRTCLFPTRDGRHFLLINKGMQKGARVGEGNSARFEIDLDREKRVVKIPGPLHVLLKQERSLSRWYDGLTPSVRNDIAKWITDPKSQEAHTRRAEQMAERLFAVMDAERELPPILLLAFGRNRARGQVGRLCRIRVGEPIFSASSTIALPMPRAAASAKCSMTPFRLPREPPRERESLRMGVRARGRAASKSGHYNPTRCNCCHHKGA
jgi:hypothetical protein